MKLGEKLARWMKETGTGQVSVSQHTGMAQATISDLILGKTKRPTPRMILGIRKLMECDLEWLIDEETAWPIKMDRPVKHSAPALTREDQEILEQAKLVDKYFGPGVAMRRLMGDAAATANSDVKRTRTG